MTNGREGGKDSSYKPHFSCGKFVWGCVCVFVDALLVMGITWLVVEFLRFLNLSDFLRTFGFNGENWEKVIGHIAWPLMVFATLFLFRNPILELLYETRGFIGRSYYKHGEDAEFSNPDPNDKNVGDNGEEVETMQGDAPSVDFSYNYKDEERKVLAHLSQQFKAKVLPRKRIEQSKYYFDGVMKRGANLYGIEVKRTMAATSWQKIFRRVADMYEGFSVERQMQFVFLACIVGDKKDMDQSRSALKSLAMEQPFPIEFRFFVNKEGSLKEMP